MSKTTRIASLLAIDAVLVAMSMYTAYLLRFDFHIDTVFIRTFPYAFTSYVLLTVGCFYYFKIYKRIWQYASVGDLISILKGTLVGVALFFILHQIVHYDFLDAVVPRSIYPLSTIISFLTVGSSRVIWRLLRDNYNKIQPHHRRSLIIGAGEAGIMVVRELKHSKSEYYPVAFIDDSPEKQNYEVVGVPVVGTRMEIPAVVQRYKIDNIIVALPSVSVLETAEILNICKETGCQIKIIPNVKDLMNGKISINMIRNVSVEDLLGRDPIRLDMDTISDYLNERVVLVTGAGGSIGSELCRQIARFGPKKLLLLGHGENSIFDIEYELKKYYGEMDVEPIIADVQDKQRLSHIFKKYRPQVVFHAAAHKHVPMMEKNPIEAVKNNIFGTKNVAECAHEFHAERFVMISTDKAVNPTNVMGATKRIAEMIIQGINQHSETLFSSVRFGNVLGSRGSVIPVFKKQISEGGPVTVTHPDMLRYFMTIPEAVQLVIQAGALANGGEIFILDMGKPVRIADLAYDLIRLSGLEPDKDIQVVYTGIRDGEKLFEELLTSEEGNSATKHDRIFVSKPNGIPYAQIQKRLEMLSGVEEAESVRNVLSQLVPSYRKGDGQINKLSIDRALRSSLEIVAALENKLPTR